MQNNKRNRFQDFYKESQYILTKNYLYNYRLRKMAVEKNMKHERPELILEVGSGISPMITGRENIIYSDLSFEALRILKETYGKGQHVVADGMKLPFKHCVFSHSICSEVLEHLEDDQKAINELAMVIKPSGSLIITFPHRKFYFANDDRFVNHFRRYELHEIEDRLKAAGFRLIVVQKVLGPLEKVTMCFVVFCFSVIQKRMSKKVNKTQSFNRMNIFAPFFNWVNRFYMGLAWLDARIMPRALSTVLLINSILSDKPATKH